MSRVPTVKHKTTTSKKFIPAAGRSLPTGTQVTLKSKRDTTTGLGRQIAQVVASSESVTGTGPSQLQKKVFKDALTKSVQAPKTKVRSVGAAQTEIAAPIVNTKRGKEPLMQEMRIEKTVQRTPRGEYIGKSMIGIDVDAYGGTARQLELTSQTIDPTHATESAGINETVSAKSSLSVTKEGKQMKKVFKKRTVIAKKLAAQPNLNAQQVNRLVKEEAEDVDTTLKLVPPRLVSDSLSKFPLKRKLQNLRLTAEPVSVLTQSIVLPTPTADEVDAEAPPEVLASVIHAVEQGATPGSGPNQIFNSLFPEVQEERITASPITTGPLEDIVVPTDKPQRLVEESLTEDMEQFLVNEVQNKQELPQDDICTENNITAASREDTKLGDTKLPDILEGELPPWEDDAIQKVSFLVGGDAIELLEATDVSTLHTPAEISQELSKGIDYFIDADVVPYETKIQIRGSKDPKWFPGYMSAFPHLPELVKISKCPNTVLQAAWKAVQPKVFPEDSLLIS